MLAATAVFWILNSQHMFQATQEIRTAALKAARPVPPWTTSFRCLVVNPDTPAEMVRQIAGRQQAKSQGILAITFLQTCEVFLKQLEVPSPLRC